jgi:hypothetical protein
VVHKPHQWPAILVGTFGEGSAISKRVESHGKSLVAWRKDHHAEGFTERVPLALERFQTTAPRMEHTGGHGRFFQEVCLNSCSVSKLRLANCDLLTDSFYFAGTLSWLTALSFRGGIASFRQSSPNLVPTIVATSILI